MAVPAELRIGELAQRLGLNPRTLRYYEQVGVLPQPERSSGGYRVYGQDDEARLRFIRTAQRLGLSLGEIREVLAFRDRNERPCAHVAQLIAQRVDTVDRQLRELRALKRELTALQRRIATDDAPPTEGRFCHYIETAAATAGDHDPVDPNPPSPRTVAASSPTSTISSAATATTTS